MYVYIVTNKINNKKYIGLSINKSEKFRDTYYGSGKLIKQAIKKYGKENFIKEIVKEFDNENDCRDFERHLIKENNAVDSNMFYNMSPGGYGGAAKGHIVSEETRQKIRQSSTGRKHTSESIEKIRESSKNRIRSEETQDKMSKSIKENWDNRDIDERKEIADKISKSKTGKKTKIETKEKLSKINAKLNKEDVINIHNLSKIEKMSYREIGKIYNINGSSVCEIVNKVSYKWVWEIIQ